MAKKSWEYQNREISWLSFNERVLQEAMDPNVPLLERVRFLGIYSNNLDEFFRVRVATISRMIDYGKKAIPLLGYDPKVTLKEILRINRQQMLLFQETYKDLKRLLASHEIFLLDENELSEEQGEKVTNYFRNHVRSSLVPLMIEDKRPFPTLNGKGIYFAVKLYNGDGSSKKDVQYSIIEIPSQVISRFYVLPEDEGKKYIILLDDVIRFCLAEIYATFEFENVEAYTIKFTRDEELDMEDNVSVSLIEKLESGIKARKRGDTVRFVYDRTMPQDLLDFLLSNNAIEEEGNIVAGGRYHNFKDFIDFPVIGAKRLRYKPLPAVKHKYLESHVSLFTAIKEKDILLSYPYQSFNYVIDLLREAAIDPKVRSIKITLYRVAKNSKVINALINAAKNGKAVTVIVELQARFDEENNIYYANKLQEEGIKVNFGIAGLKVHTKIILIRRKETNKNVYYAHIGTGNFNEKTSEIYCDHSFLTANTKITNEVKKVFAFFKDNYKRHVFRYLLVSPFNTRRQFIKLVKTEIANASAGLPAGVTIKVNNLNDEEMANVLYEASEAGVKVNLIVRSICNVIPQQAYSENIHAISLVDRLLEHSRVMIFTNAGDSKVYIGSADWMTRNIDRRVEVTVPIFDPAIKQELIDMINIQLKDNTKSRVWNADLSNTYVVTGSDKEMRAQIATHEYLKKKLEIKKS
jgi:polyphosphate kinase